MFITLSTAKLFFEGAISTIWLKLGSKTNIVVLRKGTYWQCVPTHPPTFAPVHSQSLLNEHPPLWISIRFFSHFAYIGPNCRFHCWQVYASKTCYGTLRHLSTVVAADHGGWVERCRCYPMMHEWKPKPWPLFHTEAFKGVPTPLFGEHAQCKQSSCQRRCSSFCTEISGNHQTILVLGNISGCVRIKFGPHTLTWTCPLRKASALNSKVCI